MKLNQWRTGVERHIPAIELFLKHVLLRKCKAEVTDTSEGSNEDAAAKLSESSVVVRAVEEAFPTEIFFGFSSNWIPGLAKAILGVEEEGVNEITRDLVKEFSTHLLEMIKGSLQEAGISLEVSDLEQIKTGQLSRSMNLQQYFTATLHIRPKFDVDGDDENEPYSLVVALAHPDIGKVEKLAAGFGEENPFTNGDYIDISLRFAGYVDLNVSEGEAPAKQSVNVKGEHVEFERFDKATAVKNEREVRNIDILKNVNMKVSVELGRREMPLGKVLQLVKGSVIELEKLAGEPVEILVNGQKIAQGDVVVVDEHFGVRISRLLATQEHLKDLG